MRRSLIFLCFTTCLLSACSPRDFLTRRLAADLISTSETFRAQQQFELHTGVISNENYLSPTYRALQHHGWISATNAPCPPSEIPPPCWDVMLTPAGVDTLQSLIAPGDAEKQSFSIPAEHRHSQTGQHSRSRIHLAMASSKRSRSRPLPHQHPLPLDNNPSRLRRRLASSAKQR